MNDNNSKRDEQRLLGYNDKPVKSNGKVILWLFLFFPVGLYFMWEYTDWDKTVKKYVTMGFATIIFAPLAIAMVWLWLDWDKRKKIIATILMSIFFIVLMFSSPNTSDNEKVVEQDQESKNEQQFEKSDLSKKPKSEDMELKEREQRKKEKEKREKEQREREEKEKREKEQREKEQRDKEQREKEQREKEQREREEQQQEQNGEQNSSSIQGLTSVTFHKHVDGDTSWFNYNGSAKKFRYLLIDTPESVHPNKPVQPYGPEASNRTRQLLENASVIQVEFDVGDKVDKYDRYLAYVWVDGQMVNEILVREGLAKVSYVFEPNTKHYNRLIEAENQARNEGLGIWSLDVPYDDPSHNQSVQKQNTPNVNNQQKNHGNNGLYVDPNAPSSFKNCTEMRNWYPSGVQRGHPAYEVRHDRDDDGYACE